MATVVHRTNRITVTSPRLTKSKDRVLRGELPLTAMVKSVADPVSPAITPRIPTPITHLTNPRNIPYPPTLRPPLTITSNPHTPMMKITPSQ